MLSLTHIPMCYLLVPMNGTLLFWITPTPPPLVTPPGLQTLPSSVPMTPEFGNFKGRVQHTLISHLAQHKHAITPQPIEFERLRPYYGWANQHTIEKTFHKTTQWAVASSRYPMRKHFKSRFPAFNIPRQSEEVATDTIFSDTPAIDSGVTMAQIFVGKRTLVTDVYPLKSQKQFVNTLEDNIRFRGAMTKLISDYAKLRFLTKLRTCLGCIIAPVGTQSPTTKTESSRGEILHPQKLDQHHHE